MAYYSSEADSENTLYEEKWVRINALGGFLDSGGIDASMAYDPSDNHRPWIGDYQDMWWWDYYEEEECHGSRFHAMFSGGNDQGDIYAASIP